MPRSCRCRTFPFALLLVLLAQLGGRRCLAQSSTNSVARTLSPLEFYEMATSGEVNAVVDVRTFSEWETGHVENATLIENLQDAGTPEEVAALASDLNGCRNCPIVVYCRSGARAAAAILKLASAGFNGPLYNGLGVSQWSDQGLPLVATADSSDPACKIEQDAKVVTAIAEEGTIPDMEETCEEGETGSAAEVGNGGGGDSSASPMSLSLSSSWAAGSLLLVAALLFG